MDISRISGPDVMPAGFSTEKPVESAEQKSVENSNTRKGEFAAEDDKKGQIFDHYA